MAGTPVETAEGGEKPIEQVNVGQRVATDGGVANSPDGKTQATDPNATEVDPKTWRLVNLEVDARTADGGIDVMQVRELMPLATLQAEHAKAGAHIPVPLDLGDINEAGEGAIVESIEPCPAIESGPGRVVLSTITHLNDFGFHLTLANATGQTETLGTTGFHKLYTEDRAWTSAAELRLGEHIRGGHGDLMVVSLASDPGVHRVYNLTVEADHVYYVGDLTALSHNVRDCDDLPSTGEPNSSAAKEPSYNSDGTVHDKGQVRDYGPDGHAKTDYDFGHPDHNDTLHAHDFGPAVPRFPGGPMKTGPRGPERLLKAPKTTVPPPGRRREDGVTPSRRTRWPSRWCRTSCGNWSSRCCRGTGRAPGAGTRGWRTVCA